MSTPRTRTVRFSERELERIEAFLAMNPFLDFSTLSRLALSHFIERPSLELRPVPPDADLRATKKGDKR